MGKYIAHSSVKESERAFLKETFHCEQPARVAFSFSFFLTTVVGAETDIVAVGDNGSSMKAKQLGFQGARDHLQQLLKVFLSGTAQGHSKRKRKWVSIVSRPAQSSGGRPSSLLA